ncbi:MAG: ExbD/TolR family protein [bacterium JZ-2024 1]
MDPELDFHEQGEDFLSGINLTPFVDIIFNLLIFFMLTATLALPEALEVDLPSARAPEQQAPTELVITIDARGRVRIAGNAISENLFETIVSLVRRENPQITTVFTDRKAPVQSLITVMDALRAAGQTKVSIATVAESERSSS